MNELRPNPKKELKTTFLLLFFPLTIFANKSMIDLWKKGNLAAKHSSEKALGLYLKAFELAKKQNNFEWQSNIYTDISGAYHGMGKYEAGLKACHDGLRILKEKKITADSLHFKLYSALAANYKSAYRVADAQKYYALANAIMETHPELTDKIPLYVAYHYSNQGALWLKLCDVGQSRLFYEKALQIAKKIPEKSEFALILSNLGKFYLLSQDYEKGIRTLKNAIEVYKKTPKYNHTELGKMYLMLGDFYFKRNKMVEAKTNFNHCFQLCSVGNRNDENKYCSDFSLLSTAKVEIRLRKLENAKKIIKSLIIGKLNKYSEYEFWKIYGEYYEANNQSKEALTCFSKALDTQKNSKYNQDEIKNFEIHEYLSRINYKIFTETNDKTFLKNSLSTKEECIKIASKIRKNFYNLESKVFFTDRYYTLYKDAIRLLYLLFEKKNDKIYLEKAFLLAEESKSVILSDKQITNNRFRNASNDSLLVKLNIYQSYLSFLKNQDTKDESQISEFELKINKILEKFKFSNQPLSSIFEGENINNFSKLKSQIPQQTIYLNYILFQNQLLLVACDKNQLFFRKTDFNTKNYQNHLDILSKALNQEPSPHEGFSAHRSCEYFYDLFIGNIFPEIKNYQRIILNPDNDFYDISFDILRDKNTEKYLIEEKAITYTSNLEKVIKSVAHTTEISKKWNVFLPMSNSSQTFIDGLKPIKFGWAEVRGIISDFYTDPKQGKKTFLSKLQSDSNQVLMIATHAKADKEDPYLIFGNGKTEDSRLYASELKFINSKVPLVVLGACQTNSGKTFGGLGVLSFSKSLELSGCPSVLGSFWEAEASSLSVLASLFYRNLMKGMEKDVALQKAKIEYLTTETGLQNDVPFYWAHFQVIGNQQAIVYDTDILKPAIFFLLPLILLFLIYWFRKPFQT